MLGNTDNGQMPNLFLCFPGSERNATESSLSVQNRLRTSLLGGREVRRRGTRSMSGTSNSLGSVNSSVNSIAGRRAHLLPGTAQTVCRVGWTRITVLAATIYGHEVG
jgi:hypothetical protein